MKSRTSPRSLLLIAVAIGGGMLLASPARRGQVAGLFHGLGSGSKGSQSVMLMMGRSWVDAQGASHGAFTILNDGSGPISGVTVRCSALDAQGKAMVQRSRTFDATPPIAPGGRMPFEMVIDVMAQSAVRMECELSQAH